jgi:capsular exopolysaccharide synthesis family protein
MNSPSFSDDIQRVWMMIMQRIWIIIIGTVVIGGIVFIISKQSTPIYQATTSVLINEAPATKATDYTSIVTSERLAQTYAQLMLKQPVLEGVIEQLGIPLTAEQLRKKLDILPVRDTTLIDVKVEDTDPTRAALIANAIVAEFSKQNGDLQSSRYETMKSSLENQLSQLQTRIQKNNEDLAALEINNENQGERDRLEANQAQYQQTYAYLLQSYEQVRLTEAQSTSNIVQVEPATIPERPIRPRIFVNTMLACVVGFMLTVGLVFLIDALDDTLKKPEEIANQLGLPILGVIERHEVEEGSPITATLPRTPVSEAFRSLRTNIQFASVDKPIHTLLVTSPSPAEGKSTIAVNLGVVLAHSGRKVIVVDGDLRRPRVHKVLGITNKTGLSDLFVQDSIHLSGIIQETSIENLFALTTGELPPNPSELLGTEKLELILEKIKEEFDSVIVDSPPVMAVTDSAILSPKVDGVLLVVKPGVTQMAVAKQCVELLQRGGAKLLGVVLNEVNLQGSRYYYYKGYYYASRNYYDDENHQRKTKGWLRFGKK